MIFRGLVIKKWSIANKENAFLLPEREGSGHYSTQSKNNEGSGSWYQINEM